MTNQRNLLSVYAAVCLTSASGTRVSDQKNVAEASQEPNTGDITYCNVCRNNDGHVTNPDHKFQMKDTITGESYDWTCGWLETVLADVRYAGGTRDETRYCTLAQLWASRECTCNGSPPEPFPGVHDPNPGCNICEGQLLNFIPDSKKNELADTVIAGPMPCGGLFDAAKDGGVLSKEVCPIVAEAVGAFCCSPDGVLATNGTAPSSPPPPAAPSPPPPTPPQPQCRRIHQVCSAAESCCEPFLCVQGKCRHPGQGQGGSGGRPSVGSGNHGGAGSGNYGGAGASR